MSNPSIKELLSPAGQALRLYWPAMLIIQLCAFGVVLCYYGCDAGQSIFAQIAEWKASGGLLFVAVTTIFSGGVLPEALKHCFRPANEKAPSAGELAHQFAMWAGAGMLVDTFYRLQSALFGNEATWTTLLPKVLMDQLVFTPFLCLPYIVITLHLYEKQYAIKPWLASIRFIYIRNRVLPLWVTALAFWPVMLLVVYSLPGNLQFPLFLFGNAAYSILMIFITRRQK